MSSKSLSDQQTNDAVDQPKTRPTVDRLPHRILKDSGKTAIDVELVNKTKQQIRNLVTETTELSQAAVGLSEFFEGFLNRTTSALASEGGAIWMDESETGKLELLYHINFQKWSLKPESADESRHLSLLKKVQSTSESVLIPPQSGSSEAGDAGNPTDHLLILGPLVVNGVTVGLVEIFQRPGAGPTTQRGYLRFLNQMCEIANDFLKNRRIRNFVEQQALWRQIDSFVESIHSGLEPDQTAFVIANEGRRVVDCDRLSVAAINGTRCRITAVSGLDSIERRAEQIKQLQRLTRTVVHTGEALWYCGDDSQLPPQIEKRLHEYIDLSHTKMLAILPLFEQHSDGTQSTSQQRPRIIAALIVEQIKDSEFDAAQKNKVDLIRRHSSVALTNAVEHHSLFLMPVWRVLGQLTSPLKSHNLPKTMVVSAIIFGVIAFLAMFPYPFSLGANGQLKPRIQHEVYAQLGGVLQEVFVSENDDAIVEAGTLLARMTNNDLMVQIQNLEGQINQTNKQIHAFRRAKFQKLENKLDQVMLDGELNAARESLTSLQRELSLKKNQAANLEVRSPAKGVVINWQLRKNLLKRPVDRGQNLMTVVDPTGGWQLEIEVPERRVGHLMEWIDESTEPVEVSFALISHPGSEFKGTLEKIDRKLDVYSDDGNSAKAIIRFDNEQIPVDLLKSGTRVNAKLYCGTRSVGYVWFHELFETVQTTVKYWL